MAGLKDEDDEGPKDYLFSEGRLRRILMVLDGMTVRWILERNKWWYWNVDIGYRVTSPLAAREPVSRIARGEKGDDQV